MSETTDVDKYLYPTFEDEDFNLKIFQKKEFNDLKKSDEDGRTSMSSPTSNDTTAAAVTRFKEKCDAACQDTSSFRLANYQRFVRNFLSFQTPYNSLLLYHGLGTGKTCSSILIAEEMREYVILMGMPTKGCIVVVSSDNVKSNFKTQLFNESKIKFSVSGVMTMDTCVGSKLISEFFMTTSKENRNIVDDQKEICNSFKMYFEDVVYPSYVFYSYLSLPRNGFETFNGKLIIVDEVHNIKDNVKALKEPKSKDHNDEHIPYEFNIGEDDKRTKMQGTFVRKVKNNEKGKNETGKNNHREKGLYTMKYIQDGDDKEVNVRYDDIVWSDSKTRYAALDNVIKNVENMKLLLLSATPMFDNKSELDTLIDFMRANDRRPALPEISNNSSSNKINTDNIVDYTRGYISFVPGGNPYTFPFRIYPKQFAPGRSSSNKHNNELSQLKIDLYLTRLGEEQQVIYDDLLKSTRSTEDENARKGNKGNVGFGFSPLSSALIITYPKEESEKNESKCKKKSSSDLSCVVKEDKNSRKSNILKQYEMREGKHNFFELSNLKKYGSKLADVIECGKDCEGIILVYSRYVRNGLVPLALALEKEGYSRFIPNEKDDDTKNVVQNHQLTKNAKSNKGIEEKKDYYGYALITGDKELTLPDRKSKLIKSITSSENKDGKNIKYVLISDTASEGIDFKNIRQVHILNPGYNMSRIEQTIGRAVRTCSHKELDFKKRNVEVYLHCATTQDGGKTDDTRMYELAMKKATEVGEFTRLLKQNSVDCLINQEDNDIRYSDLEVEQELSRKNTDGGNYPEVIVKVGSLPYSMDCDFMEQCSRVTCLSGTSELTVNNIDDVNNSTFNESFLFMNNDEIIRIVSALYQERTFYTFEMLKSEINRNNSFSNEQIRSALSEMINKRFKHTLYNRLSDETGFLLNIGDYYMFQPLKLTYPKASAYERRTKVPKRQTSLLTSTFTDTNKIIASLVANYDEVMIRSFININDNIKGTQLLTDELENYYTDTIHDEIKQRIEFLIECQEARKYFDEFENRIQEEVSLGESTETMGGAKRKQTKKDKGSEEEKELVNTDAAKKSSKCDEFRDYAVLKFNSERKEGKTVDIDNLRKVVAQHYVDSLSNDRSQSIFIKNWFAGVSENAIDFGPNCSNYISMITGYIVSNMSKKDKDNDPIYYLYHMDVQDEPRELMFEKKKNNTYEYSPTNNINPKQKEGKKKEESERISFCYVGRKGLNTGDVAIKILKLHIFVNGKLRNEVCGTIQTDIVNEYVGGNEEVIKECYNMKKKKKNGPTKTASCFQIEYKARMSRLDGSSNPPKLGIKYFSEYAQFQFHNNKKGTKKNK